MMSAKVAEASAAMRRALAETCRGMADLTADARFRHAAAMLMGSPVGRRAIDDSAALQYARALLSAGVARSAHHAALLAASMYAPANQVETMRDRLRRKLRR